jgi:hypothetical protein
MSTSSTAPAGQLHARFRRDSRYRSAENIAVLDIRNTPTGSRGEIASSTAATCSRPPGWKASQ